jgi:hypothetical protein
MKIILRPKGGRIPEGYHLVSGVNAQEEHRNFPEKSKRSFNRLRSALWWRKAFFKRYRRKERVEIAF